ncbi:hypothetical protein L6164_027198 [Bauhinia variegata]|uniref:Uncharacterized protein n=1 Tax=Bauhinia variegata TaxID=167791 RepID=A0ACB9LTB3_BAUVA|nr:hypothetical protein L6164_027198 [Bauhinia variegata]
MTLRSLLLLLLLCLAFLPILQSKLSADYYEKTCPKFSQIIQETAVNKQGITPTSAAAALRLFFQDCFVNGCDASILITSNFYKKSERDADISLSLPGDGFDVVNRAKSVLELECPGIVSCADILAAATRDLIVIVGGPHYEILFGRKDSTISTKENTDKAFPLPRMPLTQIISIFGANGFSVQEMVALVGAHTIGFSHCKEFADRLFNFSKTSDYDPAYNPEYAKGLRILCENYTEYPTMAAFNDVITPRKFDNMYYKNLQRGYGLLASDSALVADERTKPFVDMYAANQSLFFHDFAHAMQKVSVLNVKTGNEGNVRDRCDSFKELLT